MGNAFLYFQLVCDDDDEEEEDLSEAQGLNKRERPMPMQGPSGEEDLPEVQWLKGKRPTTTQPVCPTPLLDSSTNGSNDLQLRDPKVSLVVQMQTRSA